MDNCKIEMRSKENHSFYLSRFGSHENSLKTREKNSLEKKRRKHKKSKKKK